MWFTHCVTIMVQCSLLCAETHGISYNYQSVQEAEFGVRESLYSAILNNKGQFKCNFKKDAVFDLSQLQLYHYSSNSESRNAILYKVIDGAGPLFLDMGPEAGNYSYHIFIPGFNSGPTSDLWSVLRSTYQKVNDVKIKYFALDHSEYTNLIEMLPISSYDNAVTYTYHIGKQMCVYLSELVSYGVSIENIYIFGHSLGAHITGFTASHFKNLTSQIFTRITGIDPAAPCFTNQPSENVIDSGDADFVDIIHCNAGQLGWTDNLGAADFHPDGGESQIACERNSTSSASSVARSICSHNICPLYFANSLLEEMVGKRCDSYEDYTDGNCEQNEVAVIGINYTASARGKYYLTIG